MGVGRVIFSRGEIHSSGSHMSHRFPARCSVQCAVCSSKYCPGSGAVGSPSLRFPHCQPNRGYHCGGGCASCGLVCVLVCVWVWHILLCVTDLGTSRTLVASVCFYSSQFTVLLCSSLFFCVLLCSTKKQMGKWLNTRRSRTIQPTGKSILPRSLAPSSLICARWEIAPSRLPNPQCTPTP